jgi:ribonuclease PH
MENCAPFQLHSVSSGHSSSSSGSHNRPNGAHNTGTNGGLKGSPVNRRAAHHGFFCEFNAVSGRNGSVVVTIGRTKVLCSVTLRSAPAFCAVGQLKCDAKYAPFSGCLKGVSYCNANASNELFLANQIIQSVEPSIRVELYPKLLIILKVCVLETAPSGDRTNYNYDVSASVCAASLALAAARVEVYDVVSACTLHYHPADSEDNTMVKSIDEANVSSTVVMTLCMMSRLNVFTNTLLDGRIERSRVELVQSQCIEGCKAAREVMDSKLMQEFV